MRMRPPPDLLQQYEAQIAALERLVGKQALEIELLTGSMSRRGNPYDNAKARAS
jgi:transposase